MSEGRSKAPAGSSAPCCLHTHHTETQRLERVFIGSVLVYKQVHNTFPERKWRFIFLHESQGIGGQRACLRAVHSKCLLRTRQLSVALKASPNRITFFTQTLTLWVCVCLCLFVCVMGVSVCVRVCESENLYVLAKT